MASFNIEFTVGCSSSYDVPVLELVDSTHNIQAEIHAGSHVFTSPDFHLGTLRTSGGHRVLGRLTFGYTYDELKQEVVVCGSNYPSIDCMTLTTMAKGIDETCIERAAPCGFLADDGYRNPTWNHFSQIMPGAAPRFKQLVRDANEALIEAPRARSGLIVVVRELLPAIPTATYLSLCPVSHKGNYLGQYNPDLGFELPNMIGLPESNFVGLVDWPSDVPFSNVIGSTLDPKPNNEHTWMEVWRYFYGPSNFPCSSYHYQGFQCSGILDGGHVIAGEEAKQVAQGSNDVHIMPICRRHNVNRVAMGVVQNNKAVKLYNYLGPSGGGA